MSVVQCPCCGSPLPGRAPLNSLLSLSLGPVQRVFLEGLISAYPEVRTTRQLADYVYQLDPNGGPNNAEKTLSVIAFHLRKKFASYGWTIKGIRGRGGGFRLAPIRKPSK